MSIDVYPAPVDVTLGTMASQNANAVAITGGNITELSMLHTATAIGIAVNPPSFNLDNAGLSRLTGLVGIGTSPVAGFALVVAPGKTVWQSPSFVGINVDPVYSLDVTGSVRVIGTASIGAGSAPDSSAALRFAFNKSTQACMRLNPSGSDTGGGEALALYNVAGTPVGSITTNATATAFNTSSDVRLKRSIEQLVGALGVVQLLNPVRFLWNADDSPGEGFLAHELQQIIPAAVTGESDALNEDGSIRPQQVDNSKLVPWLVGAIKELAARVEYLETQLGV